MKSKFSIHKLLKYVADSAEAYPDALVIPTVLFTDRGKWRKKVTRELEFKFGGRTFPHFKYVLIKLFDLNARDYYHSPNPLIKILLPKMNYEPHERVEMIRQALLGLHKLVAPMLFDKYSDFIDVYAEIRDEERESIKQELKEKKETAMLMEYLKNEGKQEGLSESLRVFLEAKFGNKGLKTLKSKIKNIADTEKLKSCSKSSNAAGSAEFHRSGKMNQDYRITKVRRKDE